MTTPPPHQPHPPWSGEFQHYGRPAQPYSAPQPWPTQAWTPPPPKEPVLWPWIVLGAILSLVLLAAGCGALVSAGRSATSSPSATYAPPYTPSAPAPATAAAPTTPRAPAGSTTTVGDGIHQVGTDIPAGRYKTPGPDPTDFYPHCSFAKMKDDSGNLMSTTAFESVDGPGTVSLMADEFVKFSGGCTWTKQQ
jgi:hypothetical protein